MTTSQSFKGANRRSLMENNRFFDYTTLLAFIKVAEGAKVKLVYVFF